MIVMALSTDGKPAIELDEEQAIGIAKLNAAVHLAPQDDQGGVGRDIGEQKQGRRDGNDLFEAAAHDQKNAE